jgi:hypothetical protein
VYRARSRLALFAHLRELATVMTAVGHGFSFPGCAFDDQISFDDTLALEQQS